MATCPRCGVPLSGGTGLCRACGFMVSDPSAVTLSMKPAAQDALLAVLRQDLSGEYDLESVLGHGGMAVVYRGRERELNRPVAIKVLPLGTSPELAERFKREARVAASLDHPNVIPIYRVGNAAGTHFFAMKLVEGRALDAIIEAQGALAVPVVLEVLRGVLAGLAYAHDHQVVHRDIKGANVLVDRDGRILLTDLGIARAQEDRGLTAPGSVMGTPEFMSPEQCAGLPVGPQSDQYAVGVLTFQMLTGQLPFDSETVVGLLHHHIATPPPDLATVRADVPEPLVAIVRRALAKRVTDRFASTTEMLRAVEAVPLSADERERSAADLRRLAGGEALPAIRTASVPPPPPPLPKALAAARESEAAAAAVPPPHRRTRSLLATLGQGVLLVAVGAGTAVVMMRFTAPSGEPEPIVTSRSEVPAVPPPRPDTLATPDSLRAADSARVADSTHSADSTRVADSTRTADSLAALVPAVGWIRVLGDLPRDAMIWLDGTRQRSRFFQVSPGTHNIEVETTDFEPWERNIVVRAGDTLRVRAELELKADEP